MAYTLTLGSSFHEPTLYPHLSTALLAAHARMDLNLPIFIYDATGMVAAMGRDGGIQVYERALRHAMIHHAALKHLRFVPFN
jgi:hypothetical protein